MKASEILSENKKITEAPAGMLGQMANRVGAAALGAVGMNTVAGRLNKNADVGQFSNRYYKEYQKYLRTAGRDESNATIADLKDFMIKNSLSVQNVPPNPTGSADKDTVYAILNKTASEYVKRGAASSSRPIGTSPGNSTPADNTAQPGAIARSNAVPRSSTTLASQPFNVPALLQVIPQMNKNDLNKILTAAQTALQNLSLASKKAAAVSTPTANMTPAQVRATNTFYNPAHFADRKVPVTTPAAPKSSVSVSSTPAKARTRKKVAVAV